MGPRKKLRDERTPRGTLTFKFELVKCELGGRNQLKREKKKAKQNTRESKPGTQHLKYKTMIK